MLHAALIAAALAAPASAAPALPSFEGAAAAVMAQAALTRAADVKTLDAGVAADLDRLASDASFKEMDLSRLHADEQNLDARLRSGGRAQDPGLAYAVTDFVDRLRQADSDLRFLLQDAGACAARVTAKDPALAPHAQSFQSSAARLSDTVRWLSMDGTWLQSDLQQAGYPMEGMDADQLLRSVQDSADALKSLADSIRAKAG